MRRFWFALSLVLVFVFTASASYIYFVLSAGLKEVDEPYRVADVADVSAFENAVRRLDFAAELTLREHYALCGHWAEQNVSARQSGLAGLSYDALAAEGWQVAQTGEQRLELTREAEGLCPREAAMRLLVQTPRSLAVYEGTAEHTGRLLLEMPLDFAELPADFLVSLQSGGYQVNSQAELDELLESLDELVGE